MYIVKYINLYLKPTTLKVKNSKYEFRPNQNGCVKFKSKFSANKAISLMSSDIKHLFRTVRLKSKMKLEIRVASINKNGSYYGLGGVVVDVPASTRKEAAVKLSKALQSLIDTQNSKENIKNESKR